jgi:hypothetical protein
LFLAALTEIKKEEKVKGQEVQKREEKPRQKNTKKGKGNMVA